MTLQDIIVTVQEYHPNPDFELIRRAHSFVRERHHGQTRASGEPYISHVQEVALLAAKLRLDIASIVTALLHDSVEDTATTIEEIAQQFGQEVANLVDGVTKIGQVNFSSRVEAQAENFRKMLLAMARDIRVLLIKLCDRLHNMRTLEFLSEGRRSRIAQETLDIYAPLAHRLGIYWIKSELEDLSLRFLKPVAYENLKKQITETKKDREAYIRDVQQLITRELEQNGITGTVTGRPKSFFSIYEKMERDSVVFNEIFDLTAFRIIVPSQRDCYTALGLVHSAWKPIPGRFKDYIAMPKQNGYQSLHTTVIGPKGSRIEIQIRTPEMHEIAERGIAAHWMYKESDDGKRSISKEGLQFPWMKDLIESERLHQDPHEFLSTVKDDLFSHEVFVFSPKGDLIALARGSTPIDFAYHIHSDVGHHCAGARVNGQQVPLSHRLRNGSTIEIITSNTQVPTKDWLNIVATNKAKQRIRQWLKTEERARSIAVGKELLTKDLKKFKRTVQSVTKDGSLLKAAGELGLKEIDILFAEIGYGKVGTSQVLKIIAPDEANLDEKLKKPDSALQRIFQSAARATRDKAGVKVHGLDDMVFRFARCCEPLPGDELVGYVTRGRGVAVHARGCSQTLSFDPHRLISVAWDDATKALRLVKIQVEAKDKIGLLASLTQTVADARANIVSAQANTSKDGRFLVTFEISVESSSHLESVLAKLKKVDGVRQAIRLKSASGE